MKIFGLAALIAVLTSSALAQTAPPTEVPPVEAAKPDAAKPDEIKPDAAKADVPNASDVLFEQPQMKNVAPGTTLTYGYLRRSGIEKAPFGPPLDDRIKLMIDPGANPDTRTIRVEMFSGANRFPAGPFTDMPGNPVMTLFLEHHLKDLARVLMANPRYIKNAIRKSLRENATVTPVKATFKGRTVDAWRIETRPFVEDRMKDRMRGFDNLTYVFVTSEAVPGELLSIEAQSKNPEGGELLEEKLSYDQNAG
ncbi:hypothetical protein [Methylobacterium sp. Leaf466]|uniref:hypothetical protein n=1 Tax=Methylobacterium sp. Leaf466 TaxID=1736386 RepID=UPI0009EA6D21|nr:hypothetical protein [Methylobacterium sp. Leaf466]